MGYVSLGEDIQKRRPNSLRKRHTKTSEEIVPTKGSGSFFINIKDKPNYFKSKKY